MRDVRPACIAIIALLLVSRGLMAQTDPRLRQAVALAQDGYRDSAMSIVRDVRKQAAPGSPLQAEALYTAATLVADPDSMRHALQQVVVEQSLSPWGDDALLRLAQLDYAGGNLPAAMRDLERLRSDFPRSDVFADAAFWAARTYFDARQEHSGCEWVGMGLARADEAGPAVRDQLQAFARRCSATALAEGSSKAPPGPPRDTIVVAEAGGRTDGQTDNGSSVVGRQSADTGRPSTVDSQPGVLVARLDTTTRAPATHDHLSSSGHRRRHPRHGQ